MQLGWFRLSGRFRSGRSGVVSQKTLAVIGDVRCFFHPNRACAMRSLNVARKGHPATKANESAQIPAAEVEVEHGTDSRRAPLADSTQYDIGPRDVFGFVLNELLDKRNRLS